MKAADPAVAELIREVLAEELARLRKKAVREERVRIATDAELAAFAGRMLAIADDPGARAAFERGALVFRLEGGFGEGRAPGPASATRTAASSSAGTGPAGAASGHTEVIERGLLSERLVDRLPRETARVRLGRAVRVTPLARDRLRRRRIAVERRE